MGELALMIRLLANLLMWIVIISVVLSYFVSPYHPVRIALDRILEPLLNPIRRIFPPSGMIDFSPVILVGLIQALSWILSRILTQ